MKVSHILLLAVALFSVMVSVHSKKPDYKTIQVKEDDRFSAKIPPKKLDFASKYKNFGSGGKRLDSRLSGKMDSSMDKYMGEASDAFASAKI